MRDPRPFAVFISGKFSFTVHAFARSGPRARRRPPRGQDRRSYRRAAQGIAAMIPDTRGGLRAMACVSAMQKCIRRGLERGGMQFACELMHTCKAFHSMVCNRLEVICHEDLDTLAAPWVVPFVATSLAQSKERYSSKIGEARLMIGNCIRMMCRSPKAELGAISLRPSGCGLNSKATFRLFQISPSISTRSKVAS